MHQDVPKRMTHLDVIRHPKCSSFHVPLATGYAAFEPVPSIFTVSFPLLAGDWHCTCIAASHATNEMFLHSAGTHTESGCYASVVAELGPPTISLDTARGL